MCYCVEVGGDTGQVQAFTAADTAILQGVLDRNLCSLGIWAETRADSAQTEFPSWDHYPWYTELGADEQAVVSGLRGQYQKYLDQMDAPVRVGFFETLVGEFNAAKELAPNARVARSSVASKGTNGKRRAGDGSSSTQGVGAGTSAHDLFPVRYPPKTSQKGKGPAVRPTTRPTRSPKTSQKGKEPAVRPTTRPTRSAESTSRPDFMIPGGSSVDREIERMRERDLKSREADTVREAERLLAQEAAHRKAREDQEIRKAELAAMSVKERNDVQRKERLETRQEKEKEDSADEDADQVPCHLDTVGERCSRFSSMDSSH